MDEVALANVDWYLEWRLGIHVKSGDRLTHDGALYRCLQEHDTQETWTPTAAPSLWTRGLIPNLGIIPDWEQLDSINAYVAGDKVIHNGKTWESLVDGNVWELGAIGTESLWKKVIEQRRYIDDRNYDSCNHRSGIDYRAADCIQPAAADAGYQS